MKSLVFWSHRVIAGFLVLCLFSVAIPYHHVLAGGGPTGNATEATQQRVAQNAQISAINESISAGANTLTSIATGNMFIKENLLDGIAWAIAKQMVSNLTRSLINWINSGFQGSPAYIGDFNQLLLDSLDQVAGEYIRSLGGIGEFICSPFKLDVQAALNIGYAQARSGMPDGASENQCTLTGIISNVENFLTGSLDNWGDWMEVTSNPVNTPYGAYLEAEAKLNVRLRNEAGQEIEIASWGDGFLSKKICQAIEGTDREDCRITTPGQVISEALTFQLSTGPRSLIEADEINELIGALLNQIVLQAVQGLTGLLGLSESGYGGGGGSYLDAMVEEGANAIDYSQYRREMQQAYDRELAFFNLIERTIVAASSTGRRTAGTSTPTYDAETTRLLSEARALRTQVSSNLGLLSALIARYDGASSTVATSTTGTTTPRTATTTTNAINVARQDVVLDFIELRSSGVLSTDMTIEENRVRWQNVIYPYGGQQL